MQRSHWHLSFQPFSQKLVSRKSTATTISMHRWLLTTEGLATWLHLFTNSERSFVFSVDIFLCGVCLSISPQNGLISLVESYTPGFHEMDVKQQLVVRCLLPRAYVVQQEGRGKGGEGVPLSHAQGYSLSAPPPHWIQDGKGWGGVTPKSLFRGTSRFSLLPPTGYRRTPNAVCCTPLAVTQENFLVVLMFYESFDVHHEQLRIVLWYDRKCQGIQILTSSEEPGHFGKREMFYSFRPCIPNESFMVLKYTDD